MIPYHRTPLLTLTTVLRYSNSGYDSFLIVPLPYFHHLFLSCLVCYPYRKSANPYLRQILISLTDENPSFTFPLNGQFTQLGAILNHPSSNQTPTSAAVLRLYCALLGEVRASRAQSWVGLSYIQYGLDAVMFHTANVIGDIRKYLLIDMCPAPPKAKGQKMALGDFLQDSCTP